MVGRFSSGALVPGTGDERPLEWHVFLFSARAWGDGRAFGAPRVILDPCRRPVESEMHSASVIQQLDLLSTNDLASNPVLAPPWFSARRAVFRLRTPGRCTASRPFTSWQLFQLLVLGVSGSSDSDPPEKSKRPCVVWRKKLSDFLVAKTTVAQVKRESQVTRVSRAVHPSRSQETLRARQA